MAALAECAEEVLLQLASLINGLDVIRLMVCGNRQLNAKLCKSTILKCLVPELQSFPFTVLTASFPSLNSLSVIVEHHYYPLRTFKRALGPTQPLTNLTSLTYIFAQSFSIFSLGQELPNLLPNLKTLVLRDGTAGVKSTWLKWLPPRLSHFELAAGPTVPNAPRDYHTSYRLLGSLPSTLQTLILTAYVFIPIALDPPPSNMLNDDFPTIIWPPKLTKLQSIFIHCNMLHQLPETLVYARLSFRRALQNSFLIPTTSKLPRGLITFICTGPHFLRLLGDLPPQIETFNCRLSETDRSSCQNIETLPSSLTSFEPVIVSAKDYFSNNLPNLKTLIASFDSPTSLLSVGVLPQRLTRLVLPNETVEYPSILPETLTRIEGLYAHPHKWIQLPRGLTTWTMPDGSFLSCSIHRGITNLEDLPPRLTRLSFHLCQLTGPECLDQLPATMTDLTMWLYDFIDEYARGWTDLGSKLPLQLRRLHFGLPTIHNNFLYARPYQKRRTDKIDIPWESWLFQYFNKGQLNLATLVVNHSDPGRAEPMPPSFAAPSYLYSLPDSLTLMELPIRESWVQSKGCLNLLPPGLKSLHLFGDPSYASLTNQHFANLPKSLTSLSLSDTMKTTPELFESVLPRGILKISVSTKISPAMRMAIERYFQAEQWEGHAHAPKHG